MGVLRQYVEMSIPVDEVQELSYDSPCMNCSHLVSLLLSGFFLKNVSSRETILCESIENFSGRKPPANVEWSYRKQKM